ncbi:AfsR/SARP family transcriptional regulator [Nocardia terpenica]|uniref:AfsR/SARP family transcriptional regulator n=1 Tax=Nocardia terpenica TaxID=455432 RepID=UPI002FE3BC56
MEINLLGALEVTVRGIRRPVHAKKVRTMLAILALESGRVVSYEELTAELWPEGRPADPRNALQANATRIRRLLSAPDMLRAARSGYQLGVAPECVDANRFLALSTSASALVGAEPARAVRSLEQALQLWRGDALMGTQDSARCRYEAAYLEEHRLNAWYALECARLALGHDRLAIAELRRLVQAYPNQERLIELCMLALYRMGRQAEALTLYHRSRRELAREMGVEPSPTLERMYTGILAHDPPRPEFDCVFQ